LEFILFHSFTASMAARTPTAGSNALDSLMMSCADLNVPSKSAGFRGKPMKDVKVARTESRPFHASAKARDWSSLAQNLEDAFSDNAGSAIKNHLQPQLNPMLVQPRLREPVDDWGDFTGPKRYSEPVQSAREPARSSEPVWGAFAPARTREQAFESVRIVSEPAGTFAPTMAAFDPGQAREPALGVNGTNGVVAKEEEEEFADFVSPSPTPSATSNASSAVAPPAQFASQHVNFADFTSSSFSQSNKPADKYSNLRGLFRREQRRCFF